MKEFSQKKKKKKGATTDADHHFLRATCGEGMGDQEGVGEVSTGKTRCVFCVDLTVCLRLHWQ